MRSDNICKFIVDSDIDNGGFYNFVLEQKPEAMSIDHLLLHNRATLITKGSLTVKYDNFERVVTAGDLIFLFEGEHTSAHPIQAAEYVYITFKSVRFDNLFRKYEINKENRCFSGLDGLIPLWRESISNASSDNLALAAESMLLYAISRLTRDASKKSDTLNDVISYCEQEFNDPELSLASVARDLNYNSKYLSHIFKEKMGMPFTEYLRMLRLKHSVSLLEHGLDSIKNVALLSGFSDPLYFSSVFKKTLGYSPKDYIKKIANSQESKEE